MLTMELLGKEETLIRLNNALVTLVVNENDANVKK